MRPFQVYLDSSDFSVLSDPSKRTPEIITLEDQLKSWRNAGLIEIRFAYPHLIEAAPIAPQHMEVSKRRAQKIAELCQGKALAAQDKIFSAEVNALIGQSVKNGYVFMDDGDWLPDFSNNLSNTVELLDPAHQIQKTLDEMGLEKKKAKQILKTFITADGKLRPSAKELLRQSIPETVAAMRNQYPLDDEAIRKICHYYLDGTQQGKVYEILYSSFRNLPNFAEWFAHQFDRVSPTVSWLRESGDSTRRSILASRQTLDSLFSSQAALGVCNDTISAMAKDNIASVIEQLPITLLPKIAELCGCLAPPAMALRNLPEKAPSLFTAISVMGGIVKRTFQPITNERDPKISDMGDVLHSLYLPHVDFFRTDGFVASVMREIKLPFNTTIIGNLQQLPDAISKRLTRQDG